MFLGFVDLITVVKYLIMILVCPCWDGGETDAPKPLSVRILAHIDLLIREELP